MTSISQEKCATAASRDRSVSYKEGNYGKPVVEGTHRVHKESFR